SSTYIYTLSLHDALPILFIYCGRSSSNDRCSASRKLISFPSTLYWADLEDKLRADLHDAAATAAEDLARFGIRQTAIACIRDGGDRKSTRLNSSHGSISY